MEDVSRRRTLELLSTTASWPLLVSHLRVPVGPNRLHDAILLALIIELAHDLLGFPNVSLNRRLALIALVQS